MAESHSKDLRVERDARAEAVRTGAPEVQLLACAECGVLLWDIDAHYRQAHATGPASATRKAVTEAKAAAWDEAIAAVAAWWQTPEDERGVIVNPYGTHPADRLLEDIEKGDDHDARSA